MLDIIKSSNHARFLKELPLTSTARPHLAFRKEPAISQGPGCVRLELVHHGVSRNIAAANDDVNMIGPAVDKFQGPITKSAYILHRLFHDASLVGRQNYLRMLHAMA